MSVARIRRIVAQYIAGEAEVKIYDAAGTHAGLVSGAPQVSWLNAIAQGTELYQRIGLDFRMRRIYLRLTCVQNPASATSTQALRLILFLDTQPNGAAPPVSGNLALFTSATPSLPSMRNLAATNRYWVMADRNVTLSTGSRTQVNIELSQSLRAVTQFVAAAAAITDMLANGIYLMSIGFDAANGPSVYFSTRLWFSDL